ncbi:hypothetical protein CR513_07121, partial [Mucuna pruriens]
MTGGRGGEHPFGRNFVSALGIVGSISKPLKNFCDHSSTIFFTNDNKTTTTSKHIRIKFLINGKFLVKYIPIEKMLAPQIKGLRPIVFIKHVENMGIMKSFDVID